MSDFRGLCAILRTVTLLVPLSLLVHLSLLVPLSLLVALAALAPLSLLGPLTTEHASRLPQGLPAWWPSPCRSLAILDDFYRHRRIIALVSITCTPARPQTKRRDRQAVATELIDDTKTT